MSALVSHHRRLFAYDRWANAETLSSVRRAESPPERSRKLMAHIVAAEALWLDRIHGLKPRMAVWPEFSLDECERQMIAVAAEWEELLRALNEAELGREVEYRNSKGEAWRSSVADVLTHVVFHSAYHRGQIAADLRAHGHEPAYTDFIHAARQGLIPTC